MGSLRCETKTTDRHAETEFKSIFIGEHTSYTHAWIVSAYPSPLGQTLAYRLSSRRSTRQYEAPCSSCLISA